MNDDAPSYDVHVNRWVLLLLGVAPMGCDRALGLDERTPDAVLQCFGSGTLALCLVEPPAPTYLVDPGTDTTIDTTTAACAAYTGGEPDLCVIAATTIAIGGRLIGKGERPLVLVGTTATVIGTLDVSSNLYWGGSGTQPTECESGVPATANGGGGAGASFGGRGGNGGGGNGSTTNGGTSPLPMTATRLRGGCQGRQGHGGDFLAGRGGGAVAILASSITVDGTMNASGTHGYGGTGGAGPVRGGSGGGSGGMIVLDAPAITITGQVFANGGGGGEGGEEGVAGAHGGQPNDAVVRALGGGGATVNGGDGGGGSAGTELTGEDGDDGSSKGGGGGGGGGAGVIRVTSSPMGGGMESPPPT